MANTTTQALRASLRETLDRLGFCLEESQRGLWGGRRSKPVRGLMGSQTAFHSLTCVLDDERRVLRVWDAVLLRRHGLLLLHSDPFAQVGAPATRAELDAAANHAGWKLCYGSHGGSSPAPRIFRA
jgi:hypothetical protein